MRVGIPRSLLYYKYLPFWKTFLASLGLEVETSPMTNRQILSAGVKVAENELCVPVKAFYGHCMSLRGKVDALFVPRVVSVEERAYTCPKFLGLPDMIAAVADSLELPPLLTPKLNQREKPSEFKWQLINFAREEFGIGRMDAVAALEQARLAQKQYQDGLMAGRTPLDLLPQSRLNKARWQVKGGRKKRIGLLGHPYNIYDGYITQNLIARLEEMGAELVVPEMIDHHALMEAATDVPKQLYWSYEKEIMGAINLWTEKEMVDGVIYVLAFACGPDSLVQVLIEHRARQHGVPLMSLTIDEHSGEAGLVTRIEAFVDMLMRVKKDADGRGDAPGGGGGAGSEGSGERTGVGAV
ncbi:MAG: acyl-CoA dehydratase activase-related protein, partial [Pseudomonadota bacterium]